MRENVLIYGRYFGLSRRELKPRIDELLDFVQLTERAGDKVEPLSGGMKRRLTIARSLVNDPDLLLLDEPTTGLDPQARHVVWDRLFRLKQRGKTLRRDDALHGRGRAALRPARRHGPRPDRRRGLAVAADPAATRPARWSRSASRTSGPQNGAFEGVAERVEELPDRVLLYTRDGDATATAVAERGLPPHSTLVRRGTLEDVFLHLTGRTLVD